MEWKTIDSAPKDGSLIYGYDTHPALKYRMRWNEKAGEWHEIWMKNPKRTPSHWSEVD